MRYSYLVMDLGRELGSRNSPELFASVLPDLRMDFRWRNQITCIDVVTKNR